MIRQFITAQKGHGPVMLGARSVHRKANATVEDIDRNLTRMGDTLAEWTPNRIAGVVDDALRPLRAEIALVEKEQKEAEGMRVHSLTQSSWDGYSLNALIDGDAEEVT